MVRRKQEEEGVHLQETETAFETTTSGVALVLAEAEVGVTAEAEAEAEAEVEEGVLLLGLSKKGVSMSTVHILPAEERSNHILRTHLLTTSVATGKNVSLPTSSKNAIDLHTISNVIQISHRILIIRVTTHLAASSTDQSLGESIVDLRHPHSQFRRHYPYILLNRSRAPMSNPGAQVGLVHLSVSYLGRRFTHPTCWLQALILWKARHLDERLSLMDRNFS